MHELAERRIVPGHDRQVGRHIEAHLLDGAQPGYRHDVVVVEDRRGRPPGPQQPPRRRRSVLARVVGFDAHRVGAGRLGCLQECIRADLSVPEPRDTGNPCQPGMTEPGQVLDHGPHRDRVILPDGGQRAGARWRADHDRGHAELLQHRHPLIADL